MKLSDDLTIKGASLALTMCTMCPEFMEKVRAQIAQDDALADIKLGVDLENPKHFRLFLEMVIAYILSRISNSQEFQGIRDFQKEIYQDDAERSPFYQVVLEIGLLSNPALYASSVDISIHVQWSKITMIFLEAVIEYCKRK